MHVGSRQAGSPRPRVGSSIYLASASPDLHTLYLLQQGNAKENEKEEEEMAQ